MNKKIKMFYYKLSLDVLTFEIKIKNKHSLDIK